MSEEKKELNLEEMQEIIKNVDKNSAWSGDWWLWVLILMMCFGSWGNHDTQDHELRERVARLEGQMDMISRRDKL